MVFPRRPLSAVAGARMAVCAALVPIGGFFVLTVGVGLVHAFLQSLYMVAPTEIARPTSRVAAYRVLLNSPELISTVWHTVYVAFVSAFLAVVCGVVGAYLVWRSPPWVQSVSIVFRLPIILPHIVVAFLTLMAWSPRGHVAALVAGILGEQVANLFPRLTFAPNGIGMIVAYLYKGFPFVMLLMMGVLSRLSHRLVITSRMLGAREVRVFLRVIVPLLAPTANQAFLVLFLFALGGFDVPWLLGASNPQMLSIKVYNLYFNGSFDDRAVAMALMSILALISVFFVVGFTYLTRRVGGGSREDER